MFLKQKDNGRLVEVLGLRDLINPLHNTIAGRYNVGEELQEPEQFSKDNLVFPSGEALPRCWTDVHYRDEEAHHHYK
jgi:hypothetical protein